MPLGITVYAVVVAAALTLVAIDESEVHRHTNGAKQLRLLTAANYRLTIGTKQRQLLVAANYRHTTSAKQLQYWWLHCWTHLWCSVPIRASVSFGELWVPLCRNLRIRGRGGVP